MRGNSCLPGKTHTGAPSRCQGTFEKIDGMHGFTGSKLMGSKKSRKTVTRQKQKRYNESAQKVSSCQGVGLSWGRRAESSGRGNREIGKLKMSDATLGGTI